MLVEMRMWTKESNGSGKAGVEYVVAVESRTCAVNHDR